MNLTTEAHGELPGVTPGAVADLLQPDAFGKFAVLACSANHYIQAGNDWTATEACREFLQMHQSDPWVLEHHEETRHFRANRQVTLAEVVAAFQSYFTNDDHWRNLVGWEEVSLEE